MATEQKFKRALAEVTGKALVQVLADTRERIEMAGSVRRQVFEVGTSSRSAFPKRGLWTCSANLSPQSRCWT